MRRKFRDLAVGSLPMLTVSFMYLAPCMGTCLSIYEYTGNWHPLATRYRPDPNIVNDVAPEERWNYELLEAAGEEKFRAIVAEVKAMAHHIVNCEPSPLMICLHAEKKNPGLSDDGRGRVKCM